ncbi:hypothetical protein CKJ90_30040, partial [Klebsiella pneumoniae]
NGARVTIRTTLRSTGPLVVAGRQSARKWPPTRLIDQFGEVVLYGVVGMPAMGIGSPAEAPR